VSLIGLNSRLNPASHNRVRFVSRHKARDVLYCGLRFTRGMKRRSYLANLAISSQLACISSHAVQRVSLLSARHEVVTSFSWGLGTP
jgi:hypothetical protein